MLARNQGYGTIGTMAVAPLTDFDIGIVVRGGKTTLSTTVLHLGLAQVGQQLLVVKLAVIFVHHRDFLLQFLFIPLRQASHHKQFVDAALFLGLRKL